MVRQDESKAADLTTVLQQFMKCVCDPLKTIADQMSGPGGGGGGTGGGAIDVDALAVYKKAISDPREELILRYTKGTLKFVPYNGARYGLLDLKMFKLDGTPDGNHLTVWQPLSKLIFGVPEDFKGPFTEPSPIKLIRMTANSKA